MRLALTMGDPQGIGAEIILKALADPHIMNAGVEWVIYGDHAQLPSVPVVQVDTNGIDPSFAYLERAIADTLGGHCAGIVTGPIAKHKWQKAGHDYPGQTELLAQRTGSTRYGMLFVARSPHTGWVLRVLLATVHIPLRQVCTLLSPQLITDKLDLLGTSLQQDFGLNSGEIAIAGINPHSGERGTLGTEEIEWLIPTLNQWRSSHPQWHVSNPIPPDTLWLRAMRAWHDPHATLLAPSAFLAMYHDQGLIPVKMLAFAHAVNVTIGLPFVRTSPDHGTAFDIAGKGIADPTSFKQAMLWAIELVRQRSNSPATISGH